MAGGNGSWVSDNVLSMRSYFAKVNVLVCDFGPSDAPSNCLAPLPSYLVFFLPPAQVLAVFASLWWRPEQDGNQATYL